MDADLFRAFLYDGIDDIEDALSYFSDVAVAVADLNLAEGDRENLQGDIQPSLALVLLFLRDMETAETDIALQRKIVVTGVGKRKLVRLEVNNIDPAANIRRITDNVNATIMLSGTFSPLEAYELYCLERRQSENSACPTPPQENRLLLVLKRARPTGQREDMAMGGDIGQQRSLIECVRELWRCFSLFPMMTITGTSDSHPQEGGKKSVVSPAAQPGP